MKGAIIGDIVGSRFEFDNYRNTDFNLFDKSCSFTDDTVCTVAVADCVFNSIKDMKDIDKFAFSSSLRRWCNDYPNRGYGFMFSQWLGNKNAKAYNSFGNGSAMRVSPCGWVFDNVDGVLDIAKESAECTHNHLEGIKGAEAVADCIFVGRNNLVPKEDLKDYISKKYGYDLGFTCNGIRKTNKFDETCQVTVPQAIVAFLDSSGFESAIRLAVSIGGDSDTIAAITGSIAEAYYGIPDEMWNNAKAYLPKHILDVVERFYDSFIYRKQRPFSENMR